MHPEAETIPSTILPLQTEAAERCPARLPWLWKRCWFGITNTNMKADRDAAYGPSVSNMLIMGMQLYTQLYMHYLLQARSCLLASSTSTSPTSPQVGGLQAGTTCRDVLGPGSVCVPVPMQGSFFFCWDWI